MEKIMTLDVLSNIKGAKASKDINELFEVIKSAIKASNSDVLKVVNPDEAVTLDDLREDKVIESALVEKEIIKSNFPKEKNGYLVVSKVIED